MKEELFSCAREAAETAGSKDPRAVADSLGIMVIDICGSICGYASVYRSGKTAWPVIGLHRDLPAPWDRFGGWHELAHVLRGHVYDPSFANRHCDCAFFEQEVSSRTISLQEKEANLISADMCIEDALIVGLAGLDHPVIKNYRQFRADLENLVRSYEQLTVSVRSSSPSPLLRARMQDTKRKIRETRKTLQELEEEIAAMSGTLTLSEIAAKAGTTERILRYKLEAMRIKGYDIDHVELEPYDKMFRHTL